MNQQILQKYVEETSIQYFDKPFKHKAVFNPRLRTTGGRYHLGTHHLDFNLKIYEEFGEEVFRGIVKHELCHYHLHLEGKGFKHGDKDFKNLMKQVGGLRYTPSLKSKQESMKIWEYQCTGCKKMLHRRRRFNTNKYVCGSCQSFLTLIGQKEKILKI